MNALRKLPAVIAVLLLASALLARDVGAQSYRTGVVSGVLQVQPTYTCGGLTTWYNPTVFTYPNGDLGLIAQTGRAPGGSCPASSPIDDYYSARRNSSTGAWTVPGAGSCPTLKGGYARCGYSYPSNPGPLGNPSVVKVGSTYYMAFNGGNADYIVGRIYWATSTDGLNWSVYNVNPPTGEVWTPIVAPRDHECTDGRPATKSGGIVEAYLAFDPNDTSMGTSGTFYLYFSYWGFPPGSDDGFLDNWAIRFAYAPGNPFGIGTSKQIWHRTTQTNGAWRDFDSGRMVWKYDGLPAIEDEPLLEVFQGENPSGKFGWGAGDLKRDPVTGKWLHVYSVFGATTYSQTATSLSSNLWSSPVVVNDATIRSVVPPGTDPPFDAVFDVGLHHGQLGNRTGWWAFSPVNHLGCEDPDPSGPPPRPSPYGVLGIVPAELCTAAASVITSVAPSSGPTTGGTAVTITGSGLDCVSSVTFGGSPAAILSRRHNQVQVSAPARPAGTVNVVATTPSGSATRLSGYTYTAPPAYGGYHEGIACYSTFGWAWDANRPTTPITVDVYDGSTLIGSATANLFRQDLLNAGIGDGRHGFGFNLPASVRNGAAHTITVKFGGTSTNLSTTPKSINCRSLSITKSGTGTGTVTSSPAGIQCGTTCAVWFPVNWAVALAATPASGSTFAGWSGQSDCLDGSVTLSANRSCTATFNSSANARVSSITRSTSSP